MVPPRVLLAPMQPTTGAAGWPSSWHTVRFLFEPLLWQLRLQGQRETLVWVARQAVS